MNRRIAITVLVALFVVSVMLQDSARSQVVSGDNAKTEEKFVKFWEQDLQDRAAELNVTTMEKFITARKEAKLDEERLNKKIDLAVLVEKGLGGRTSTYFLNGKLVGIEMDYPTFPFLTPTLAGSLAKTVDETLKKDGYVKGVAFMKPDPASAFGYVPDSDAHFFKKYTVKRGAETTSFRTVVEFRTLKTDKNRFRLAQIRLWDENAADVILSKLGKEK